MFDLPKEPSGAVVIPNPYHNSVANETLVKCSAVFTRHAPWLIWILEGGIHHNWPLYLSGNCHFFRPSTQTSALISITPLGIRPSRSGWLAPTSDWHSSPILKARFVLATIGGYLRTFICDTGCSMRSRILGSFPANSTFS